MLHISNLEIFREQQPFVGLDAQIQPGEVLSIIGPSGSGKTTLLNWIAGYLPESFQARGELMLNNDNLTSRPAHLRRIGVMYQDPLLFNHMSVGNNVAFGMPARAKKSQRRQLVAQKLTEFGLNGMDNRHCDSLSGGQQARVALLRVLMCQPKAILLDEPFSKLDSQLRKATREMVFQQIRTHALPVVMVTHDHSDVDAANGPVIDLSC